MNVPNVPIMGKFEEALTEITLYPTMSYEILYKRLPHIGKSTIRKAKMKYLKTIEQDPKIKNKKKKLKQPLKLDKVVKELDAETIEKLIVKALNEYSADVQVLKLAVDYYTRIKINQGESMDLIDMKQFLKIGETVAYDPTDI